jgi:hypothetical protein
MPGMVSTRQLTSLARYWGRIYAWGHWGNLISVYFNGGCKSDGPTYAAKWRRPTCARSQYQESALEAAKGAVPRGSFLGKLKVVVSMRTVQA